MDAAIRKAEVLIEALEYIRTFRNRQIVIKLGGSAMEERDALRATLQSVVFLSFVGLRPILVHGGGKPIDRAMAASGLEPKKVLGRRITDDATLAIVVKVLTAEINDAIVRLLRELGGKAFGLHSATSQVLFGERLMLDGPDGKKIDLGRVGRVTRVECETIDDFTHAGVIPVIPSLAQDDSGGWLNVNADTAAAAVAAQMKAAKLVMMTDTPGILRDRKAPDSLIPSLTAADCRGLIRDGVIDSGMIPKVEACLEALQGGVGKTHIIDGRLRHSLLLEIFTDKGVGTEIAL
jgi:acetylglutamate kinase